MSDTEEESLEVHIQSNSSEEDEEDERAQQMRDSSDESEDEDASDDGSDDEYECTDSEDMSSSSGEEEYEMEEKKRKSASKSRGNRGDSVISGKSFRQEGLRAGSGRMKTQKSISEIKKSSDKNVATENRQNRSQFLKTSTCSVVSIAMKEDENTGDDEDHLIRGRNGRSAAVDTSNENRYRQDNEEGSEQNDAARREANIKALLEGSLDVSRKPLLSKLLTVKDAELVLKRAFKSPHPNAPSRSVALRKALVARKTFVPWGSGKSFQPVKVTIAPFQSDDTAMPGSPDKMVELPPGIEPLILWEPPAEEDGPNVRVDDSLTRFLRPHQREGVQFMFECVSGLRNFDGNGCILADDMGLGKTLQGITLLWTLLNNGHEILGGNPIVRRAIICCPTSLVSNWDSECTKWLNGKVKTLPLCESSRDDVISTIDYFLSSPCPAQVLIVSYETFRLHAERFRSPESCDLLICDEAHRLKNDQTLTNKALDSLACRRRVLLSGTPMQNQLQEFYAMVNFCNPGILGTPPQFRKYFEVPILSGREPDASEEERALGETRSSELSGIVNEFILRRTNNLLSAHLPPKVVEVVCCRMTSLQYSLYCHFLQSRSVRSLFASQKSARVLSAITSLRKLLNHPKLIYDMVNGTHNSKSSDGADGFANARNIFPPGIFESNRASRGQLPAGWENFSGKFAVVARMLALLREQTKDRVVIVSNFTQTLDLFSALCRERGYPCLRLDGSISISKRQKLVKRFNDPKDNQFVFLLSSKAGGCGLNLVGGNRLILFDMSWNPADDKQAAARVWRDGQQRRVYVYRLMTTGTIEEKVYQRQLSKEGLQAVVDNNKSTGSSNSALMSIEELRDLFSYDPETLSSTYDHMVAGKDKRKRKKGNNNSLSSKKKAAVHRREQNISEEDSDFESESSSSDSSSSEDSEFSDSCDESDWNHEGKHLKSKQLEELNGCIMKPQVGHPKEEDLASWGHHSKVTTVPDEVMKLSGGDDVTFVFSCQVEGREVPEESRLLPPDDKRGLKENEKTMKQLKVKDSEGVSSRNRDGKTQGKDGLKEVEKSSLQEESRVLPSVARCERQEGQSQGIARKDSTLMVRNTRTEKSNISSKEPNMYHKHRDSITCIKNKILSSISEQCDATLAGVHKRSAAVHGEHTSKEIRNSKKIIYDSDEDFI